MRKAVIATIVKQIRPAPSPQESPTVRLDVDCPDLFRDGLWIGGAEGVGVEDAIGAIFRKAVECGYDSVTIRYEGVSREYKLPDALTELEDRGRS